MSSFDRFHSVLMMSQSGARGSKQQIRQLAGMRGLMADPTGRIIDLPIKANFSEGLTVLEYFISTHGARKGLADTALRTADFGVPHPPPRRRRAGRHRPRSRIARPPAGICDRARPTTSSSDRVIDRYQGRIAAQDIVIGDEDRQACRRGHRSTRPPAASSPRRSGRPRQGAQHHDVQGPRGRLQTCYGRNLATGRLVEIGEAVGVIAAQSIGEPGTQLTMRTFHTGGVATGGSDITQGLPRVEELFEARVPKGKALISEIDGVVEVIRAEERSQKVKVTSRDVFDTTYPVPLKARGARRRRRRCVAEDTELIRGVDEHGNEVAIRARYAGHVKVDGKQLTRAQHRRRLRASTRSRSRHRSRSATATT